MPTTEAMPARLPERIERTAAVIRARWPHEPGIGIILGTRLARIAERIAVDEIIEYGDLPGFAIPTVEMHLGRLLLGTLAGKRVIAMQGRFHRYEGYSLEQVTFPVRVMRAMGAETLIVSNVSGGMNPMWSPGELVLIEDHINLLGDNPLIGPNWDELGPRFPDMSEPYDRHLQRVAREVAVERGIPLNRGVYVAVPGPNLETRAEYRMLRGMGADVVGMSTVPEVIVAVHGGMRVLGLSIITDACLPDALEPVNIEGILAIAAASDPALAALVEGIVERI
jgi:purine-nucleoside phosphorylase